MIFQTLTSLRKNIEIASELGMECILKKKLTRKPYGFMQSSFWVSQSLWWFNVMVRGGLWWFVVIRGGSWWFVVVHSGSWWFVLV